MLRQRATPQRGTDGLIAIGYFARLLVPFAVLVPATVAVPRI